MLPGTWQSFTAGMTGNLSRLALLCSGNSTNTNQTFAVYIYSGVGTGGTLIGGVGSWVWENTNNVQWRAINFTEDIPLTAGQVYTWAIDPLSEYGGGIRMSQANGYGGGRANGGSNEDWNFGTYMSDVSANMSSLSVKNGNVGIRTSNPSAELEVNGVIKITGGSPGDGKVLSSDANGLASWTSPTALSVSNLYTANGSLTGARTVTQGANTLTFASSTGHLVFNPSSTGNVGIGTTNPVNRLQLNGGNLHMNGNIIYFRNDPNDKRQIIKWNSSTDRLNIGGWSGTTLGYTDGAATDAVTPVLTVNSQARVGIGNAAPDDVLDVAGFVRTRGIRCKKSNDASNYGGNTYNLYWGGSWMELWVDNVHVGNLQYSSDRRLKESIEPLGNNAIERVMQLRPVKFNYKDIPGTIFKASSVRFDGFIADELQQIIPSAVSGEKDALTEKGTIQPQTVNAMPVVSVLTKAMQEQQKIIEAQQAEINAMKAENGTLKSDVDMLKTSVETLQQIMSGKAQK